jgi:hypothetical protein
MRHAPSGRKVLSESVYICTTHAPLAREGDQAIGAIPELFSGEAQG